MWFKTYLSVIFLLILTSCGGGTNSPADSTSKGIIAGKDAATHETTVVERIEGGPTVGEFISSWPTPQIETTLPKAGKYQLALWSQISPEKFSDIDLYPGSSFNHDVVDLCEGAPLKFSTQTEELSIAADDTATALAKFDDGKMLLDLSIQDYGRPNAAQGDLIVFSCTLQNHLQSQKVVLGLQRQQENKYDFKFRLVFNTATPWGLNPTEAQWVAEGSKKDAPNYRSFRLISAADNVEKSKSNSTTNLWNQFKTEGIQYVEWNEASQ